MAKSDSKATWGRQWPEERGGKTRVRSKAGRKRERKSSIAEYRFLFGQALNPLKCLFIGDK